MAGVHAVAADSAHAFGRHMHDQYGLGLMLRGAQKSLSGRGVVEAEEGDLITVNPGEVHDGAPIGDGGRAWRMLYFEPEALAGTLGQLTE
ncbi:MAG TPA: AraC family ligand binding domain-containing protein, partial [Burkholderiaceae bacterium]|nr:AraC family ligand binding domain-containing protein [Burkholderiaceae bacterium]